MIMFLLSLLIIAFMGLFLFLHFTGNLKIALQTPLAAWPLGRTEPMEYSPLRDFNEMISGEEMKEDLGVLKENLLHVHPATVNGLDRETEIAFQNALDYINSNPSMSIGAFNQIVAEIIATLKDAHTEAAIMSTYHLPMTIKKIDGQWFLMSARTLTPIPAGSELISIGGLEMEEIYKKGQSLTSYENQYWLDYRLASRLLSESFLSSLGIDQKEGNIEIQYKHDGTHSKAYTRFIWQEYHPWTRTFHDDFVKHPQDNRFKYFIDEEGLYAHFVLSSMPYNDAYKAFLEDMFKDIEAQGVRNLIVDLRYNTGGNCRAVDAFLRYIDIESYVSYHEIKVRLSQQASKQSGYLGKGGIYSVGPIESGNKRKNKQLFDGDIFVCVNEGTYSAAVSFAQTLKDNDIAKVIGSPTGGSPNSYGDLLFFYLPHSKIPYTISHKKFTRPNVEKADAISLYPHIEVFYSVEDYLKGRDLELEAILEMIQE